MKNDAALYTEIADLVKIRSWLIIHDHEFFHDKAFSMIKVLPRVLHLDFRRLYL